MRVLRKPLAERLADQLDAMDAREVRRDWKAIARLLRHRSTFVRGAAARALEWGRVGASALTKALAQESNDLVITDLADALAAVRENRSLPRLRQIARSHRSSLARTYAVLAIAKIQGKDAIPFLLGRRKVERSPRALAAVAMALFQLGLKDALPDLLRRLSSRDYHVRCSIANMLADARPRRRRATILAALKRSLEVEPTVAARSSLERAVADLSASA